MTGKNENARRSGGLSSFLRRPFGIALCGVVLIGTILLLLGFRIDLAASGPYLLPLAICVLIHLFMHRGHGGHGKNGGDEG